MIADKEVTEVDELLFELADFALANDKKRCFPDWTRESVKNFFQLHLNQKTLLFAREQGELAGFVTWWRWNADDIPDLSDDDIFLNPPPFREDGDLMYISDVVTTKPNVMRMMGRELTRRNPDYAECEIWGTRKDKRTGETKRVRYSKRLLDFINNED